MAHNIQFGSKQIAFKLSYANRKSLSITVTPELNVLVNAPNSTTLEKIKEKVRKRAPWIIRQENFFLSFHPRTPARKYVSGESHLFLGRQYRLKVIAGKKNSVKHQGRFIEVVTKKKTKARDLMKLWYRRHAKSKFAELAKPLIEKFKKYKVEPSGVFLRQMATRWGSCTPKGKIILNPELIKAHPKSIEYVIVHELCHLVHHNHTRKFFELQEKQMNDWEKRKDRLERVLV